MKFTFHASPNLRQKQSTQQIMLELMIGLLVVFAFSLIYYNQAYSFDHMLQAIKLLAVSLLVAFVTELAWAFFMKKDQKFELPYIRKFMGGSFGWITAIILTLMCPISIRPYALGVSTFFAIFFAKLLFGGFGNNIFNPAAVGRAIVFATFMGATTDVITSATPTTVIASEFNWLVTNPEMIKDMMSEIGGIGKLLTGWYPGAIGETSAIIILLVGVVLSIRRVIDWRVPAVYLGSIFVLAAGIALLRGVGSYDGIPGFLWYPLVHVLTGGVVFGAVFMLTDPVTSPTSAQGRCIFALGAAIITVLIRVKANLPEGCLYSILMMNMLTPMIEKGLEGKQLALRKKATIIFSIVAVVGMGSVLLAGSVIEAKEPAPAVMLNTADKDVNKFEAKLSGKTENSDGTVTYHVESQGYASTEDPTIYNKFDITVKDDKIVTVVPTEINDTPYQGDKIDNPAFLDQFIGQDLKKDVEVEKNDAVTEATFSSKSTVRAVEEVRKALGY